MQRSKAIGLLHKQVVKDSSLSRMGVADYIVTMRAPGDNPEPCTGGFETFYSDELTNEQLKVMALSEFDRTRGRSWEDHKSIAIWQRYAEPIWIDIAQSEVLSHRLAREVEDERHISPLQLTVIRRCVQLWTNPGDVVFSPFAGIGSAGYVAIELGRRFIGAELKRSYYDQAIANIKTAERERASQRLL
jgi:DNA modification methylase